MKTKLKSLFAATLCAVGLTASALQPSPFRDFWSSHPDSQPVKDPTSVIDWGTASMTFESREAKHGKFLAGSADAMIAAYTARIEKDPTDCEAHISRALAYLKKAGENKMFDDLAKEFGYTFDNDTMHFTGELVHEKGVTPEMNDASDEVCDILLPLLKSAYTDLCAVPKNWKGSVAITPDVYPVDEEAYFDYADSLGARAALAELMCVLNMVKGFDVAMDSDKLEDTFNAINQSNGKRGVQALFENNPEFFSKVRDQKALTEAGDWWASAATLLDQWDKAHCRRSDDKLHFFDWNYYKLDSNGTYGLEWLRRQSAELANLPYWASPLDYEKINGSTQQFTSFKPLFGGKVLRANLPEFGVGVKAPYCNEPLIDTCPDSTICGMWPSVSPTYLATYISTRWTDIPAYTDNRTAPVYGIWYKNMFDLGFDNEGNPLTFAWDNATPIKLLDPKFNVRGVTAVFKGWSGVIHDGNTPITFEGSEIPTPISQPMKYVDRRVELTANFDIPKVTYLDLDEKTGKPVERTVECELVTANTTEFTTGKVYAVVRDITIANRITVWSTPENPAKLVLCDGATLAAAKGVEVDVFGTATNALVICGQALGTGTLEATGSDGAAGIGGSGTVTINGGTVMANGGSSSAGISGTVTINGGTVTATGSDGAAGIAGTVTFAKGTAYGVAAGADETNALYRAAAAYAADHSAAYVALPYFSLKIPEAGENYTYEVSSMGAQPNAVLADGTNTYAIAAGATARVRFTPDRGYMWADESFDNPMIIASISEDSVVDAADLPTVVPAPAGHWNNPWEIGTPNAADVVAYTNWVDGKLTLVVEGKGAMMDNKTPPPWDDFGESIQSVKVGWGVTKLGKNAFANLTNLSEVDLPEGLLDIGEKAFYSCSDALAEVTIPSTVTSIGESAFYNCRQIQSLTIPGSVRTIGKNAFAACTSLTHVEMEPFVPPTAGEDPFAGRNPDLQIKVQPTAYDLYVTAPVWKDYADMFIKPIRAESDEFAVDLRTSVELAAGETTVSNVAWSATAWGAMPWSTSTKIGWMNLDTQANGTLASDLPGEDAADFALPKKDGEYRLTHSAGGLMSFVYFKVSGTGAKVGSISNPWMVGGKPGDTVAAYVTDDGELVIGGKGEMGDQFVENPPWAKGKITSLTIGRNVTSIPDYAFFGYTELSNVTFATGAQLESIGSHAFAACPNMEELEIPASVTTCGPAVIAGTPNVTVNEDNETFAIVDGVLCDIKSNKVISGLDAAVVTIPEGMVEIGECAFSTNGALTSVTIPASVTNIAAEAFKGCANLTNVFVRATEPPTLVQGAFKDCNDGLKIYVPEGKAQTYMTDWGWSDYAGKISDMKGAGSKTNPWAVGTGVTAYIENGTLHVEGFGEMMDFTTTNAPWAASAKDIKAIEVAKGVTKIGNAAFAALDYAATTTALTFQDEDHVLNLLAFVSADGSKTNAPEAKAFSVYKDSSGTVEPIVAFQTPDLVYVSPKAPPLMRVGYDEVLLLTLLDLKAVQTAELIESAGEQPYSKTMQGLLDEALDKIEKATNYGEVVDGYVDRLNEIVAQAEEDKSHEIEGTDITWRVLDGMLVIEGEGEMPDFVAPDFPDGAPWDAYTGDITNVTVAAGVAPLGTAAFAKCPTGKDKTVSFEDPAEIDLAAFVSGDGSVTNDFTVEQILVPGVDGGVTNAVKFLADTDPDAPRYDSIAEAIASNEVSFVTACSLDGLKELSETWIAAAAGPQPWTERVEAAVTNAIAEIEAAADADSVLKAGTDGISEILTAKGKDDDDPDLGGETPNEEIEWELRGGQLTLDGSGSTGDLTKETAPWSNSVEKVETIVVGEEVTELSKGLFTSELSNTKTVIFESKTASVPLDAFVSADGSDVNDSAAILFVTDEDKYVAPSVWTDAAGKTYGSYAEALEAGATAVQPVFASSSDTFEDQIDKAPAEIGGNVQSYDEETGKYSKDSDGNPINSTWNVKNVNTNDVETSERIVATDVSGLNEAARAVAEESSGRVALTLTIDAQPADPENTDQIWLTDEMEINGKGFEAKFAEITLATNDVPVAEAKALIEIHIPYVTEGRENFSVTRMHDGKVEMFTEIFDEADKADGTFMVGDGEIVVWTDKFSGYAIGSTKVDQPEPPEDPLAEQKAAANAAIEQAAGEKPWSAEMTAIVARAEEAVNAATTAEAVEAAKAAGLAAVREQYEKEHGEKPEPGEFVLLYPNGDGAFRPAVKSTTYYGTLVGTNGVEGTITLKMTKPNRKGQFNLSATVKNLVDKQSYSFKAKKVTAADGVAADDGALTFLLVGSNKKSKEHALVVTLGGDSLTGAFDGCLIDGARHVFATSRDPKRAAVLPFLGTWTGAFTHPLATMESVANVLGATFSAKLSKNGSASVKVYFADGKTASCSAKAEVGADIVVVPVTLWRSVKGGKRSLGFRLVFSVNADGEAVCEAADVAPVRDWTKKTDETVVVEDLEFLAAGLQTVTAKEFKSYVVTVDPALTAELGPITKSTLRLSASTGLISGSLKWKVASVDARGREKAKTVTGKANGVVVNGIGIGTVTVKQGGVTESFAFVAEPAGPDTPLEPVPIVIPVP